MGRLRAERRRENSAEPVAPRAEGRAWGFLQWTEKPAVHAALLFVLLLAALVVRLPHAYDSDHYFQNHADEATYFNKAQEMMQRDAAPLAHGGSGLPGFLKTIAELSGQDPVAAVGQGQAGLSPEQLTAARLAYLTNTLVGVLIVAATYALSRPLVRPAKALLATSLVAFDPFLLQLSGHLMAEQLFTLFVVLAAAATVRASRHPGWLVAMAIAMAFASMMRGNGLVVFAALAGFAFFLLRRSDARRWGRWLAAGAAVYVLVQTPYLAWRSQHLPGAFDYGTNGRFFADRLWDFSDPYWQNYTQKNGGPKEGFGDYLATHSAGDVLRRLYLSVQMQVVDLFGGAQAGHRAHPEGTVLQPLMAIPLAIGLFAERKRPELRAFLWVGALSVLALVWMYWIHDSPRYFSMLVPLAAPVAVEGLAWLGKRLAMAGVLAVGFVATHVALNAALPAIDGLAALREMNPSWAWTFVFLVLALILALAGPMRDLWRENRRANSP
ncbi:MAG: phospholipid carrier-dependent glycosyltransferase [Candidatus Thermoplasmatota archaeon]|jgi:4-amino-4-deoxy-L-arabinose transferase-like glycosyltransferase